MIDYLIKKTNLDPSIVPFTANYIGNTGPASIPIAICLDLKKDIQSECAVLCGFGVGLSWATCNIDLSRVEYHKINI
jgi:3-oxoacyl-[acyl-carrier-protein] synthase III